MSKARLFYSDEARAWGVPEAVLVNYLRLFLRGNLQRGNHIDADGVVWTYTTYEQIAMEHEFWTVDQVGRLVRKLRDAGVIRAVRRGMDGNTWFSFVNPALLQIDGELAAELQRTRNEIAGSTIYTEVILKSEANRKRFTAPTYSDVKEYAKASSLPDHSLQFVDYYEAAGWTMGKRKMKDWKAAYRNWCRNEAKFRGAPSGDTLTKEEFAALQRKSFDGLLAFDPSKYYLDGDTWRKR